MRSSRASSGISATTRTGSWRASPPSTTSRQRGCCCAAPRANYLLRTLPPHLTADFAAEHDAAVARCLATLLEQGDTPLPPTSLNTAQLAQRFGGLGLRSASQDRFAAHWASWCDMHPPRDPRAHLRAAVQGDGALPSTAAATHARAHLRDLGFEAPDWADLCSGAATAPPDHADDRGRSRAAVIRARTRRIFQTSPPRLERCCCRRRGPSPPAH